jgi:hypothetical protein
VRVGQRRDAVQEGAHRRVAFVAVLDAAQVAAVALGVVQEGHEVRDADVVDGAGDAVAVVHATARLM